MNEYPNWKLKQRQQQSKSNKDEFPHPKRTWAQHKTLLNLGLSIKFEIASKCFGEYQHNIAHKHTHICLCVSDIQTT